MKMQPVSQNQHPLEEPWAGCRQNALDRMLLGRSGCWQAGHPSPSKGSMLPPASRPSRTVVPLLECSFIFHRVNPSSVFTCHCHTSFFRPFLVPDLIWGLTGALFSWSPVLFSLWRFPQFVIVCLASIS